MSMIFCFINEKNIPMYYSVIVYHPYTGLGLSFSSCGNFIKRWNLLLGVFVHG